MLGLLWVLERATPSSPASPASPSSTFLPSPSHAQVAAVRDSVVEAFHYAEEHKACYLPYRDMVLFHSTLDIAGLAPLFKAKDEAGLRPEDSSAEGGWCGLVGCRVVVWYGVVRGWGGVVVWGVVVVWYGAVWCGVGVVWWCGVAWWGGGVGWDGGVGWRGGVGWWCVVECKGAGVRGGDAGRGFREGVHVDAQTIAEPGKWRSGAWWRVWL